MNSQFSKCIQQQEERLGVPLIVGKEVLISLRMEAQSVVLKGDFDAWAEGLSMQGEDGFWWAVLPFDASRGLSYKFLIDETWHCDPQNQYISFGPEAFNSCIPAHGKGAIVHLEDVYAPQLDNSRSVFVYVPRYGEDSSPRHILYAQDGFNVFSNPQAPFGHWALNETLDHLIAKGEIPPIIVVGIDTPDRMNEYSWSSFAHGCEIVPKIDGYAEFIKKKLHPMITKRWASTQDVGVMGASLGGSSALWLAWHHDTFFSRVASFSGSFWMDNPSLMERIAETKKKPNLRIYLDSGDCDGAGVARFDADNLNFVDAVHHALCEQGWHSASPSHIDWEGNEMHNWEPRSTVPTEELCMVVGRGHQHREEDWALRVRWALRFLYADLLEEQEE